MSSLALLALGALSGCDSIGGTSNQGASQAALAVFPDEDFLIAGLEGGPFFPEEKVYLLTNTGDEELSWSARASATTLGFSVSSGTLASGESELVTVFVNTQVLAGLGAGNYKAGITFTNETTGAEVIEHGVSLNISAAGELEISPSIGFSSTGLVGGPFSPLSAPYTLDNTGSTSIDWAVAVSETWIGSSLPSGTLGAGGSQNLTISINATQAALLPPGNHIASVRFQDLTHATAFEIFVSLAITAPATLVVTPTTNLISSGQPGGPFTPAGKLYTLSNPGSQLLQWQASKGANWVILSSTTGTLAPGQQASVVVGINAAATASLPDGTYDDQVSFVNTTNGAGNTVRGVQLTLTSPPAALAVTPAQGFSSSGPEGGPFQPASKTYTLSNTGGGTMNWQVSAPVGWLTFDQASGSLAAGGSTQVVVSIQQGAAGALSQGQHAAQVSFTNLTGGSGSTSRDSSLSITSGSGAPPVLTPGAGFTGPTPEPGQIGSGSAKCIARWDVVPYQTIVEETSATFTIGVIAFHLAGIDRVAFSLEGGPFIDVTAMTLNPRTGVWEYCATIDANLFSNDKAIEVRAIAYPGAASPQSEGTGSYPGGGYPRLLDGMRLYVDVAPSAAPRVAHCSPSGDDLTGDGSLGNPYRSPWRAAQHVDDAGSGNAGNGVVLMDAGTYTLDRPGGGNIPRTPDQWLTFRSRPGLTRGQVRITSSSYPGLGVDHQRFYEVTVECSLSGDGDLIWMDRVTCQGAGIATSVHWNGWNNGFDDRYWTGVEAYDNSHGAPDGASLIRDTRCERVQGGPQTPKLIVNSSFDTLEAQNGAHSSLVSWNFRGQESVYDNVILYGVTATNLSGALGIFYKDTGHLRNVAFVNVALQLTGSGGSSIGINCQEIEHLLMWNFTHRGPQLHWGMPQSSMHNLSIRGCHFDRMALDSSGADSVADNWFDQNSFGTGFGTITPGTNVTTSDPLFVGPFELAPLSPLRNRTQALLVPIDKDGAARTVPGTIGAVE